jgi:small multidrug resistance pump
VTVVAAVAYKEIPDKAGVLRMSLIVAGILVLNLWSKSASH